MKDKEEKLGPEETGSMRSVKVSKLGCKTKYVCLEEGEGVTAALEKSGLTYAGCGVRLNNKDITKDTTVQADDLITICQKIVGGFEGDDDDYTMSVHGERIFTFDLGSGSTEGTPFKIVMAKDPMRIGIVIEDDCFFGVPVDQIVDYTVGLYHKNKGTIAHLKSKHGIKDNTGNVPEEHRCTLDNLDIPTSHKPH